MAMDLKLIRIQTIGLISFAIASTMMFLQSSAIAGGFDKNTYIILIMIFLGISVISYGYQLLRHK